MIQNVPFNSTEYSFLELSTVENHSVFYWDFVEASPYSEKFRNRLVRYETSPHFLFSRLHPRNIMHNIHDDILGLFYHIRQYVGRGEERWQMPFSLDTHHLLLLDPYGQTDSTRPLQYLSDYPVRFKKEFLDKNKEVTTCFRDATVGNSKIATFYQYGFVEPQSKLMGKDLNGMYVKEVAEWFVRRMREKVGFDEDVHEHPPKYPKNQYFGNKVSDLDLKETDLIVILRRKSNRLILNEDELANALTEQFKLETVFVSNEDHTFENQVKYLRRARAVLAMHGSILMMIMFCRRGTVVIEMFPFAVPSQNYTPYKTLAELTGMELVYRAWENKDESATVGHPDNHELMGGLAQLTEKERQEVLDTKTVPTHICCTSRFWLYRIYQDTKVNLKEVGDLITDALQESRDKVLNNLYEFNWDEAVFVKPPPVFKVECLNGTKRKSGELWASWDEAWNEAKVDKWNVYIVNSKSEYATNTEKPAIAIPGFKPGELVKFQIRPLVQGYKGFWGSVLSCTV